jgi:deoxyribonuclease V
MAARKITPKIHHDWDLTPEEAVALQKRLAPQVVREAVLGPVTTVAGVDASYKAGVARAAVVVLAYPDLEMLDYAVATRPADFPYVPGLLTFREGPVALDALGKLSVIPDLLVFDGHGIAHPRRLGIASHIGLLVDIPSIGCAKRRLCGQYEEPGQERGDFSFLTDAGETLGAAVCTRTGVKPVFVSIGHRVDLPTGLHYILSCCRGYRLPEPTRWADRVAGGEIPPPRQLGFAL